MHIHAESERSWTRDFPMNHAKHHCITLLGLLRVEMFVYATIEVFKKDNKICLCSVLAHVHVSKCRRHIVLFTGIPQYKNTITKKCEYDLQ